MITTSQMYWITMLDSIGHTLLVLNILLGLTILVLKKNGKIGGILTTVFRCPDCGALIGCYKSMMGRAELAEWLSQFKKQD